MRGVFQRLPFATVTAALALGKVPSKTSDKRSRLDALLCRMRGEANSKHLSAFLFALRGVSSQPLSNRF